MGDALCGPSNALQNFQKHASVDRTLQQDRLTSRQSPVQVSIIDLYFSSSSVLTRLSQGFRSQSSRDGILDPEFAAFEANLGGPALPDLHHPVQFGGPARLPATLPATSHANSSWASDFQNLHITSPSPAQFQRPAVAPAQTGWQNEFLSQQQRAPAHHAQTQSNMTRAFQPSFQPSYPMYNASLDAHQALPESQPGHLAPAEQFDESAFEAAFEQARTDVELHGADATPAVEQELHETGRVDTAGNNTEEIRIGSDTIPQTDKQDPQAQAGDADALAQTAGHLLDSVRHDQSEKFQQSNFLALMRRIRDREVQVEGDEFREVSSNP